MKHSVEGGLRSLAGFTAGKVTQWVQGVGECSVKPFPVNVAHFWLLQSGCFLSPAAALGSEVLRSYLCASIPEHWLLRRGGGCYPYVRGDRGMGEMEPELRATLLTAPILGSWLSSA